MKKNKDILTDKQDLFAYYCALGEYHYEAYKLAGYEYENKKSATIRNAAHKLYKQPKVKLKVEQYREELKEQTNWDFVLANKELRDLMARCKTHKDFTNLLNVIKELNKLNGLYDKQIEIIQDKIFQIEIIKKRTDVK